MLSVAHLPNAFSSALWDHVQALDSPYGSPQLNMKSKYIHDLRPDRDSNAGPTA